MLETIFRGAAGGGGAFTALFGELVSTFLGTKYVIISFDSVGHRVSIPHILEVQLEYLKGPTGKIIIVKRIQAETIWVNHMQPIYVDAPWGGYKMSGIGRELGPWGAKEYLQVKQVYINLNDQLLNWYGRKKDSLRRLR